MRRLVSGIMLTLLLMILLLSVNVSIGIAQPPPTQWSKTYGGAGSDGAYSVVQTGDGGYALAGETESFDAWLVKTDSAGTMLWNKTYGGAAADLASSVMQRYDGGYALAGSTASFGAGYWDFWLVMTDASGNLQWSKTYGGAGSDGASSVVQTGDGGYALAGYTYSFGSGNGDAWLVKADASGNLQWSKTYGGAGDDFARTVVQTGDGGYALAGRTYSFGAGNCDAWLVKADASGNLQWSKTYGGAGSDGAYSVVQTGDGGYALAGDTSWDFWLVKADASGNLQWNKTYGGANSDRAYSVVQTGDGGYALAGYTLSFGAGGPDFWLVKADASGNLQWNKTYGGASGDYASSVVQTGDGGYALAGSTASFGAGSDDFWLVKVAPEVHDVAVTNVTSSKTVVGQGYSASINITVENQGDYTETFNVTLYANETSIELQTITLTNGSSTTLTFAWNTSGFAKGNYSITVCTTPVPGEIYTADNNCTGGLVAVTIPGDVTGEGLCDMQDISMLIDNFLVAPPAWNPNCDVNDDLTIDMADISLAIDHFMQT